MSMTFRSGAMVPTCCGEDPTMRGGEVRSCSHDVALGDEQVHVVPNIGQACEHRDIASFPIFTYMFRVV
jgi:hypothetical protein